MTSAYKDSLDIANRACQHLGVPRILDLNEDTRQNIEISAIYDQLRQSELREHGWSFAKTRALLRSLQVTSRLLSPQRWSAQVTYLPYSIVSDSNGDWWFSRQSENLGNEPGTSPVWDKYFGAQAVDTYIPSQSGDGIQPALPSGYYAGELVYMPGGHPGTFVIYMSLVNGNITAPNVGTPYDATVIYGLDDRVFVGSTVWRSLITYNIANTPAEPPAFWAGSVTYSAGNQVRALDGFIYQSVTNSNKGNDPLLDNGTNWADTNTVAAWESLPADWQASQTWTPLFCDMVNLDLDYLQAQLGPRAYTQAVNTFRLPAGCLRDIKLDPKQILPANDWEIIGNYLSSFDSVILFPFIKDVTDVAKFDSLFCEALAARIALETCETITQSPSKMSTIASKYNEYLAKAGMVNGIELGPEEADEDTFLTVRM